MPKKEQAPALPAIDIPALLADLAVAKKVVKTCEDNLARAYREQGDQQGSGYFLDMRQSVSEPLYTTPALRSAMDQFCDKDMLLDIAAHFLDRIDIRSRKSATLQMPNYSELASLCENWNADGGKARYFGEASVGIRTEPAGEGLVLFGTKPRPKGWEASSPDLQEGGQDTELQAPLTPGD